MIAFDDGRTLLPYSSRFRSGSFEKTTGFFGK
jgi:hypothetical protein